MDDDELEGSNCDLRYYPGICLEGLRKAMENLSQDSQFFRQDSNWVPHKYRCCHSSQLVQYYLLCNLNYRGDKFSSFKPYLSLAFKSVEPSAP
jgi:hypothetical protein